MEQAVYDLLQLPAVTRVQLSRSPLVLAVCQVQFSAALSVSDPAARAAFQRDIQDEYPVTKPTSHVQIQVGFGPGEADVKQQTVSHGYSFGDQDDNWAVVLTLDSLSIETRVYHHFPDFQSRLRRLLIALRRHIQPTIGIRLGLRYINEVRSVQLSWSDVIRPQRLGRLATPELAGEVVQAAQETALRYPGHRGVTIRSGLLPQGTTVRPRPSEEPPNGAFYLLDFDVFREFPATEPLTMDPDHICDEVSQYHELIYRLFRWSVTDRYLDLVRQKPNDAV